LGPLLKIKRCLSDHDIIRASEAPTEGGNGLMVLYAPVVAAVIENVLPVSCPVAELTTRCKGLYDSLLLIGVNDVSPVYEAIELLPKEEIPVNTFAIF
jgi:hypothetical protein